MSNNDKQKSFHMTPEEFRRHGHAVIDWIADYRANVEKYPVLSQAKPGQIRAGLPANPPAQGEAFEKILGDIDKLILPGVTHWQSPNFFAYFPSNSSEPGILGDLLSSGLGVQGMLWATSPACTELETHVLDWLVNMLGSPQEISFERRGRRGDSGYGFDGGAVRFAGGAGTDDGATKQSPGMRWQTGGLCIHAGTFGDGKSGHDCRHWARDGATD